MKKITTLLILALFSFSTKAQTAQCDCSEPLNKDLNKKYSETELQSLRSELYEFYEYSKTDDFKSGKKFNFTSEGSALTNYGYFESLFDFGSSSRKSKYKRIDEKIEKDKRVSINTFKEIVKDEFSKNQLTAYESCLDLCATATSNGVFYEINGDLEDVFSVNIIFRNTVGQKLITLKDNPTFINCDPIGGVKLKKGDTIKNFQSITQYLKIIDNSKTSQIGINFNETNFKGIDINDYYSKGKSTSPIGSIISTVLKYDAFLELNKIRKTDNMSEAIWVPCDGRNVSSSKYGEYSGNVPDLRGLFLRGINDYSDPFPGVSVVNVKQANPDNTNAGVFQSDTFKSHNHTLGDAGKADWDGKANKNSQRVNNNGGTGVTTTSVGGSETRPKNVTVYYYIRIN